MKKRRTVTSSSENKTKSEWFKSFFGAVIGGLLVIACNIVVNPIVAKRVMIQESITQKRYEACEKAIELMQRSLASAQITGGNVPEEYTPSENAPTQLEFNSTYIQLVVYIKSLTLAEQFFAATYPGNIKKEDIVKFVSSVRKELGVDDKDITKLQIRLLLPKGEDGLQDKEAKGL